MATIAFRVDASLQIGTGHVMRCLTLADALLKYGAQCYFICRPHAGNLLDLIAQRGHQALALPDLQDGTNLNQNSTVHGNWLGTDWATDVSETQQVLHGITGNKPLDWLVVDHYALERRWEQAFHRQARRVMVIDDLADRLHDCDLLLDQNLGRTEQDYADLLAPNTTRLIGPQYALLRPEFAALRSQSLARRASNPQFKHLLITMGGVDKDNATEQVLISLADCDLPSDLLITVVMGPHAPWLAQLRARAAQMRWRTEVLVGVNNMAQLMVESDLAIGAAGSTSWERCCLGLPTIQVALADNQIPIARALSEAGAALMMTGSEISQSLPKLIKDVITNRLQTMTTICSSVTQGQGAEFVSCCMKELNENHARMQ